MVLGSNPALRDIWTHLISDCGLSWGFQAYRFWGKSPRLFLRPSYWHLLPNRDTVCSWAVPSSPFFGSSRWGLGLDFDFDFSQIGNNLGHVVPWPGGAWLVMLDAGLRTSQTSLKDVYVLQRWSLPKFLWL